MYKEFYFFLFIDHPSVWNRNLGCGRIIALAEKLSELLENDTAQKAEEILYSPCPLIQIRIHDHDQRMPFYEVNNEFQG